MSEGRGVHEHEKSSFYSPFSEKEKESLRKALVKEIRGVEKARMTDPNVYQFVIELLNIVQEVRKVSLPKDISGAKQLTQQFEEIQNQLVSINSLFLSEDERDIKEFFKKKIQGALQESRRTHLYFLTQEINLTQDTAIKSSLLDARERIVESIKQGDHLASGKMHPPKLREDVTPTSLPPSPLPPPHSSVARIGISGDASFLEQERALREHADADNNNFERPPVAPDPSSPPPALSMPTPGLPISPISHIRSDEITAPNRNTSRPSMPSTGGWKQKLLVGFATLAGFFGVKIGFEKAEEVAKENIEAASDAFHYFNGDVTAKMAEAGRAPFDQQPSEPPDAEDEKEPLTRTYTVEQADTLWGYANKLVEEVGTEDVDGTIALGALKKLREANDIQGDPARSKKMWVGATIDATSAYDFVVSHKQAEQPASALAPEQASSPRSTSSIAKEAAASPDATHTQISPELAQNFSPELLSHTLNHPSETIWSRTHAMLESLDVKPNMARRGVLGAIVLADSHMSETQAMRVKYAGHKKFDATKDTLDFTRAAQAALDLQRGMSPGDVAKKYGVKNVYEKIRSR